MCAGQVGELSPCEEDKARCGDPLSDSDRPQAGLDWSACLRARLGRGLVGCDVFGVETFGALPNFKLHAGSVVQGAIPGHLNCRVVNENIFTGMPLDKAVPFG
jgi:hypothetical protein